MNILILTSYTKNITWDDYGNCDYGNLSSINHLKYSQKHNYSYLSQIVDENDYTDRHLTWIKIDIIKKKLPFYDYIVWIDADAIFMDMDIKIENFLKDDPNLVLPKMVIDKNTGNVWTSCSTGFMVWKNCEWSLNLLNDLWDNPGKFTFEFFHEQSLLDEKLIDHYNLNDNILSKNHLDIESPVMLNKVLVLPYSYQGCYYEDDFKFIYHAAGDTPSKYQRLQDMIKIHG
tara:strand:- start:94426 stop:95115 length:690 start_codon:yes stop_codon:yes gene_type:complete